MLKPLGNMKEDHGPPSLVPTKWLSFSNLLETKYHEKSLANAPNVDMLTKKKKKNGMMPQMKMCFHARRTYLHTI